MALSEVALACLIITVWMYSQEKLLVMLKIIIGKEPSQSILGWFFSNRLQHVFIDLNKRLFSIRMCF